MVRRLNLVRIQAKMIEKGLTQKALAELIEVDQVRVSAWFTAKNNPCWANIIKLADGLDLEVEDILLDYNEGITVSKIVSQMFLDIASEILDGVDAARLEELKAACEALATGFEKYDFNVFLAAKIKADESKEDKEEEEDPYNGMTKEEYGKFIIDSL